MVHIFAFKYRIASNHHHLSKFFLPRQLDRKFSTSLDALFDYARSRARAHHMHSRNGRRRILCLPVIHPLTLNPIRASRKKGERASKRGVDKRTGLGSSSRNCARPLFHRFRQSRFSNSDFVCVSMSKRGVW